MGEEELPKPKDVNSNLETEGLSGIDLKIGENHRLRIAGIESNFRDGKGTKEEPLEPIAGNDLTISLKDANYIANLLESDYGLKRTIYVKHGGRLLGVDANADVQFIRDKEELFSQDAWNQEVEWLKSHLENMKKEGQHPKNWTLSAVDLNEE